MILWDFLRPGESMGTIMSMIHVCRGWRQTIQGCLRRNVMYAISPAQVSWNLIRLSNPEVRGEMYQLTSVPRGIRGGLGLLPWFVHDILRSDWPCPGVDSVVKSARLPVLRDILEVMYTTPDWQWDFRVPDLLQAQINAIYDCDVDIADCHRTLARFRLAGGWD